MTDAKIYGKNPSSLVIDDVVEEKSCQACGRYTKAWRMVLTATGRKQRRCSPCADRVHKPGAWLRFAK